MKSPVSLNILGRVKSIAAATAETVTAVETIRQILSGEFGFRQRKNELIAAFDANATVPTPTTKPRDRIDSENTFLTNSSPATDAVKDPPYSRIFSRAGL